MDAFYSSAESCPSLPHDDAPSSPATAPAIATSDRHLPRPSPVFPESPVAGRRDASSGLAGYDLQDQNFFLNFGLQEVMAKVMPTGPSVHEQMPDSWLGKPVELIMPFLVPPKL